MNLVLIISGMVVIIILAMVWVFAAFKNSTPVMSEPHFHVYHPEKHFDEIEDQ